MATLTLRPNSDSTPLAMSPTGDTTNHYANVDESSLNTADYNSSYSFVAGGTATDIYGFPNHSSEEGIINNVTLYVQAANASTGSGSSALYMAVKMGGTVYETSKGALGSSTLYSLAMSTNPNTSAAWTWDDIDNFQAGAKLLMNGVDKQNGAGAFVYWVYAVVDYTTIPAAPTNVSATENDGSKVVITWTKSAGATGYRVYRDGVDASGLLGDVATFDDTGADAPVITAGTATASDGTYDDKVSFSLSGNSIADGTKYTYTVKATSDGSTMSAASSSDTGYRKAQTVTYQWQKSTGDATFASFSNISGKTSSSGDDTDAPENGQASPYAARYYKVKISATGLDDVYSTVNHGARDAGGRYYKCALSATGSTTVYSTADRGYRSAPAPESSFIQEIMRVFYTP